MSAARGQIVKLWIVLIGGLIACVAGIIYAVCWGVAADGGRGGAVAVALAFGALFTSTPSAKKLIEAPDEDGDPGFDDLPQPRQISRLRSAIATILDSQGTENIFLVITSVAGTLTWAFGDVVAGWCGAPA